MTYGPFDLSDARQAEVRFWLWIDTQPTYDYLALEVSTTSSGSGFQEIARWSGSATSWQEQVILIPLDNRLDYSSVWIAWRFYSNSSTVADGPWVDDVLLRKYVAGQVTPQGAFSYYNRNSSLVGARYTKVSLFESDPVGGDDLLATTNTDANGFFQFPVQDNWDGDDSDPNPFNRKLDLYVMAETDYSDSGIARRRVTDFDYYNYQWPSSISSNVPDGTVILNASIPSTSPSIEAMWIFQDLRSAWEYVRNNTSPQIDPGSVTARWEQNSDSLGLCAGSCFFAIGDPYIFIADNSTISVDTIVHEASHHYMYNATG